MKKNVKLKAYSSNKVAFIATVYQHIVVFHLPFIELLQQKGYEVHVYASPDYRKAEITDDRIHLHDIPFQRSPFQRDNLKALRLLTESLKQEQFRLIHVHTPVASILGRLAARRAHVPCVIYTAHGFHFFKGAPFVNWMVYYPVEKWMAKWTDHLVTINQEDYERAQAFRVKRKVHYVPGVGVDTPVFQHRNSLQIRKSKRDELGIQQGDVVMTCIAELIRRKNQVQLIQAIHRIVEIGRIHVKCLLVGNGENETDLKHRVRELGLEEDVLFLGFRRDVPDLLLASDIIVLLSYHEGLPKALLEALSAGKPILTTDVRGNRDLVEHGVNGFVVPIDDIDATVQRITELVQDESMRLQMGQNSLERSKSYDIQIILEQMEHIYDEALNG